MDRLPQNYASDDDADFGGERAQLLYSCVCVVGVGFSCLPKRIALDACGVDVSDVANIRASAVVCDGGVRGYFDSDRGNFSIVPARDFAWHCFTLDEMKEHLL